MHLLNDSTSKDTVSDAFNVNSNNMSYSNKQHVQVGASYFQEIEPEDFHLHAEVASILSDTDSVYAEADSSGLNNVLDHINTIAVDFQNMVSSTLSFIKYRDRILI